MVTLRVDTEYALTPTVLTDVPDVANTVVPMVDGSVLVTVEPATVDVVMVHVPTPISPTDVLDVCVISAVAADGTELDTVEPATVDVVTEVATTAMALTDAMQEVAIVAAMVSGDFLDVADNPLILLTSPFPFPSSPQPLLPIESNTIYGKVLSKSYPFFLLIVTWKTKRLFW
mgnify:CR=1 FL=1